MLLFNGQEEFDLDRKQRMEREAKMVKQLTDHEHETAENFEIQIVRRILKIFLKIIVVVLYGFMAFFSSGNRNLGRNDTQQLERCWKITSN